MVQDCLCPRGRLRALREGLRRQPKARSTKQKARIGRANAAIEQRAPRPEREAELRYSAERQGNTVLEIDKVSIERGGERLVTDLELRISAGQRIGVVGPNGAGKSSLLLAILGELELSAGEIRRGQNTRIGHLDQLRSGLDDDKTVFESLGDRGQVHAGGLELDVASYLERFIPRSR